jgi:hypothetical protein
MEHPTFLPTGLGLQRRPDARDGWNPCCPWAPPSALQAPVRLEAAGKVQDKIKGGYPSDSMTRDHCPNAIPQGVHVIPRQR